MKQIGLIVSILSIVIAFFNYHIAILIFGIALILFGGHHLQTTNRMMAYIYFFSGFIFIIGIIITEFGVHL